MRVLGEEAESMEPQTHTVSWIRMCHTPKLRATRPSPETLWTISLQTPMVSGTPCLNEVLDIWIQATLVEWNYHLWPQETRWGRILWLSLSSPWVFKVLWHLKSLEAIMSYVISYFKPKNQLVFQLFQVQVQALHHLNLVFLGSKVLRFFMKIRHRGCELVIFR